MSTYQRIPHAAHYAYNHPAGGHDLEQWTFAAPVNKRPDDAPADAEYHVGFVKDGVQHWVYVRTAPLSPGACDRCRPVTAEDRAAAARFWKEVA